MFMSKSVRESNCSVAYQLNWLLSLFSRSLLPPSSPWLSALQAATEPDGVRILEFHASRENVLQFFVSTLPQASPADVVRSVKGRLQYLVRDEAPRAFR